MSTPATPPDAQQEADETRDKLLHLVELRECLQEVMPIALVRASSEAAERVVAVSEIDEKSSEGLSTKKSVVNYTTQLAAALGVIAPAPTAAAVTHMLGSRRRIASLPRWLRPRIDPRRKPKLATMTSFSKDRSRLVREAIEESTPVLISRHGRILAAIIPLEPGAYDEAVYRHAGQVRRAANASRTAPELDEMTAEEILSSDHPEAEASALGIDTSDWADLNPES
jgi:hypothetical protein